MIALVGATGLVGLELRQLLAQAPLAGNPEIRLFASQARPQDKVYALDSSAKELGECDFILNMATSEIGQQLREGMTRAQVLIDNSSAFRMDPDVPLVVPEVNGAMLEAPYSVIANPNCTTILLCLALNALKDIGLQRVIVATYQAASGAGIKGLEELDAQLKAAGTGAPLPKPEVFPYPLMLNVLSHNTPLREEGRLGAGYNEEEGKVIEETRKILGISHLPVSATCMRVPVRRAHTEAVTVDLKREVTLDELRKLMAAAPGLKVVDEPALNHFPMPLEAEGVDEVLVGRMRRDVALPRTVHFVISGDQLRKGAALNALQILRKLRELRA
ncbi:MAG: aspartate-semialdehyde dehydrogenase [Bdellovibrionales bacterium]|nr:aspartate-semialdehyde dehydrogenase [Bdellovibrionales bacterium]